VCVNDLDCCNLRAVRERAVLSVSRAR
jgi:hypothetical protein